jgi:hypothetical protein
MMTFPADRRQPPVFVTQGHVDRRGPVLALRYLTWKGTLLDTVPTGLVTSTVPVVAPAGMVVLIRLLRVNRGISVNKYAEAARRETG